MKKKTPDTTPPIPKDFAKWCETHGVTSADIARETGVGERQARRYLDNTTPVRLAVWKTLHAYVKGG